MMCLNDPNRSNVAGEQEDFVDVVANVGGRALDGAKVGAVGGTAGVLAGAALGGAVGAAQTVQADRQKASAKTAQPQPQSTISSVGSNKPATDVPGSANPIADSGPVGITAQQQLTQLIALITNLLAQSASSSAAAKNSGLLNVSEEHGNRPAAVDLRSQREEIEADESESAPAKQSADRRLQRSAAIQAAKSVTAINSARAQQQQAAKKIAREQRKLAALGVVPARPKPGETTLPRQSQMTRDIPLLLGTAASVAGSAEPVPVVNQPVSPVTAAPKTTAPPLSPEVTALLDQLAEITPLLAQLAIQQANIEVVSVPDQQASMGVVDAPASNLSNEEIFACAVDPTLCATAGVGSEEDEVEDLRRDYEGLSLIFPSHDSEDDESILEWISEDEDDSHQAEWMHCAEVR